MNVKWAGTPEELQTKLADLPRVFAGQIPDTGGAVQGLLLRMGMAVLARIKDNFIAQSMGQSGVFGTWKPLSPVTLALRRIGTGKTRTLRKSLAGMKADERSIFLAQVRKHHEALKGLVFGTSAKNIKERNAALQILEKKKKSGAITAKQYADKRALLIGVRNVKTEAKLKQMAIAGAFANILRDTGRLLNSLSPGFNGADQVMKTGPGWLEIGTNIDYAVYHQSNKPRKLKKDGTGPRLPRRQFLPDSPTQVPALWLADMTEALQRGFNRKEFWLAYLGSKAS